MRKKLKSQRGESIGEVLAALLISALGLVLLAAMITSATRMIDRSKTALESYTNQENLLATKTGDSGTVTVEVIVNGKLISSRKLTEEEHLDDTTPYFQVEYFKAAPLGGKSVISYDLAG